MAAVSFRPLSACPQVRKDSIVEELKAVAPESLVAQADGAAGGWAAIRHARNACRLPEKKLYQELKAFIERNAPPKSALNPWWKIF